MSRSTIASAWTFIGSIVGALYAAMLVGCYLHEFFGHGLTAVALGGTFHEFVVTPAAHGVCYYDGVPERLEWAPLWAGIVVNLLCGLIAIVVEHARPPASGHARLALLAIGVVHTGQAIGYS